MCNNFKTTFLKKKLFQTRFLGKSVLFSQIITYYLSQNIIPFF